METAFAFLDNVYAITDCISALGPLKVSYTYNATNLPIKFVLSVGRINRPIIRLPGDTLTFKHFLSSQFKGKNSLLSGQAEQKAMTVKKG